MDQESVSLLPEKHSTQKTRNRPSYPLFKVTVLIALCYLSFLETVRFAVDHETSIYHHDHDIPYSPANSAIQYSSSRIWQEGDGSKYEKEPSPELDALWNDLLTGQNVRITEEEMILQGENLTDRAELEDGGYLGLMSVWHSLHCLDILRRNINHYYYYPRLPESERGRGLWTKEHSNHCIERLRSDVMCHPNIAVYIPKWVENGHHPDGMAMRSNGETSCVNWDALDEWARKRALKDGEYKLKPGPYGKGGHKRID
ncbi:hypothetical protein DM02DRAFT_698890 [Periconia macrospinosa]|uniref:Uncharacterized protein n=1 Tax=Periconia macrospinosa TaxID=97972 RepID=A0A2V1DY41_9PLEO|nr:hypothetical protein DM02DRAFT_698890 [Periconia macrospinosa]